jgi:hypothetical protein
MKLTRHAITALCVNLAIAAAATAADTSTETASITGVVLQQCGKLPATPTVPNGNTATEQDLVTAMKSVKAYQSSVAEYRTCLDKISTGLTAEEDQAKKTLLISLHNRTVDDETQVGDLFNSAVRAFKGRK